MIFCLHCNLSDGQFDIEDFLVTKGFEPLREDEWVGDCPHCGKERKVAVNTAKKTFHCWVCQSFADVWDPNKGTFRRVPQQGAGGLIQLVEWLDEVSKADAIRTILECIAHTDISELGAATLTNVAEAYEQRRAPAIPPPDSAFPIQTLLPYLHRRGITMDDVQTYGLFWCPAGRYANRVVFPVWEQGALVYWQARALYDKNEARGHFIKSLNPPKTPGSAGSSEVLMNIDTACRYDRVAIVEGPTDLIRTGPDAVCTFGKQIHPRQIELLHSKGVRAIDLMWDGPSATEPEGAQPEMLAAAARLVSFFDVKLVFLPQGDPGDWDRASLSAFRHAGVDANYVLRPLL